MITYFTVLKGDFTLAPQSGKLDGIPVWERPPSNFVIVVEGRPGGTGADVGDSTFNWNPNDPTVLPDLQIEVSRSLGSNPTADVCDDTPPSVGGVLMPPLTFPDFSPTQPVANWINDFACRFKDGFGAHRGRGESSACFVDEGGLSHFLDTVNSRIQFCGAIDPKISFPVGDTTVAVRIRDVAGHLSAVSRLIIRVLP